MLHSVSTATPQRISFMGGGSDIPSYFRQHTGAVVSMAIRQYVYVTVKRHSPLFEEKYRISYSKTESVHSRDEIQNDIIRSCIEFSEIDEPLHIITSSDLPSQSGLGSSSSFCVGLLKALHELRGDHVSVGQLAEEACEIEINLLEKPIGKQDQYAAAFGGLNYFEFNSDESVTIESLPLAATSQNLIEDLFLLWTGVSRSADDVLSEQGEHLAQNIKALHELVERAKSLKKSFRSGEATSQSIGAALSGGWKIKKTLGELIDSNETSQILDELTGLGSYGHKISGAGGGGFILGVANQATFNNIRRKFGNIRVLRPGYSPNGSWTVGKID